MKNIRAAAVQFEHAPGDKAANMRTIDAFVQRAVQQDIDLLAQALEKVPGFVDRVSKPDLKTTNVSRRRALAIFGSSLLLLS